MSTLPNPDTYLNHLPPAQAAQFEAARNLSLAVLGATIWDILVYIPDDIKILSRSPFHLVTLCFVTSRLFALTFTLLAVIEFSRNFTLQFSDPLSDIMHSSSSASTTFIFLQRLRAVYSGNRRVQIIAIVLWIGTCVTMALTVVDARSAHIPGTQYCAYMVVNRSLLANGIVFVGFDTFAFLAITYKIGFCHLDVESGAGWTAAISGKALPRISRAVLRGGQQYYLITLCLQIPVLVLTAIPSVSPNLKLMLTFPLGCLAASMACRIFRNMKMNDSQFEMQPLMTDVHFAPSSRLHGSGFTSTSRARVESRSLQPGVPVTFPQRSLSSGSSSPDDIMTSAKH
ncbi:hypothetical protein D9756_006975 [Leucocoprinus leucothites]|uniref:Uncharacterized protein n=1 Tax=Leucocoprinus leucothites TaxID=201217 RepID=A0A8H5FYW1_9AGAR|nr:hypothetical protein D9756_006975 [Leucoagaricus leucothites]